jgi:serine protease AprX
VAPGRSVLSLRAAGSNIDTAYPAARVGTKLFKGSGTSQSSAVVSGAIADLLQVRPSLTPDQVKALAKGSVSRLLKTDVAAGAGQMNMYGALLAQAPAATQRFAKSTGTGTLEAARGTNHVRVDDVDLTGETDIGRAWSSENWNADYWGSGG